jgi:xanthine dehydrogenase small subunit
MKNSQFSGFLDLFASPQIKNSATLVGNVCNASPIADSPPYLLAMDCTAHLLGPKGKRTVPLSGFFLGYRKTALGPGECMIALEFALPLKSEKIALYKTSQRKDLDISAVNAAFRMRLKGKKVSAVRIAYGGIAATPLRIESVEKALMGQELSSSIEEQAVLLLQKAINPVSDLRGSSAFRRVIAGSFLRQFIGNCRSGKA